MKTIHKTTIIKKTILVMLIALAPIFTFGQSVFDAFEDMDDVSAVIINKRAFKLMTQISGETTDADEYVSLVSGLDNLKVFATENTTIAAQMKSKVSSYLKSAKLSELMRVKDKDGNVKIYIREGVDEDHVSELLMFVDGISKHIDGDRNPEAVIISITGNIDLNKISKLTSKLNIKGGEHLSKAEKKN